MTQREDSKIISVVHPICCGLDVHKESISACMIYVDENGVDQHDIKIFETFTKQFDAIAIVAAWLRMSRCGYGEYWDLLASSA